MSKRVATSPGCLLELRNSRLDDGHHVKGRVAKAHHPVLEAFQIEKVIDDVLQRQAGALQIVQQVALLGAQITLGQQMREAEDAGHRCANLVAHVCEKHVLRPRGSLRRIEGLRQVARPFFHDVGKRIAFLLKLNIEPVEFATLVFQKLLGNFPCCLLPLVSRPGNEVSGHSCTPDPDLHLMIEKTASPSAPVVLSVISTDATSRYLVKQASISP